MKLLYSLIASVTIFGLTLVPSFVNAMDQSEIANTIFAQKTKNAPISFSKEKPGKIHIINNEPFEVAYGLSDYKWEHNCDGYLKPNQETTVDLSEFEGFSKLVIYRVIRDEQQYELLVPEHPYIWSFQSREFKKSGGTLHTKDAYVPIEED